MTATAIFPIGFFHVLINHCFAFWLQLGPTTCGGGGEVLLAGMAIEEVIITESVDETVSADGRITCPVVNIFVMVVGYNTVDTNSGVLE